MIALVLIGGFLCLIAGAEILVRGTSRLAAVVGLSPLVVGLTVVAYGTSAPEMVVSVVSGIGGQDDIGHLIARWEGGLFLGCFLAYTSHLVLAASGHEALPAFSGVMVWFVVPLTALTLLVIAFREARARTGSA